MQGQDLPIHVVPFVFEQLGAHDTFFSSSSFTRTHTHSLFVVSLFKQKRYVYVFYTRERDTKVLECVISFSAQLRATKKVGKSHLFIIIKKVCVCDSSFQCCSARVLLLFFQFFHVFDKVSVFFVRWFWALFFEQVVFALALFVVTSVSDVFPVVKRHFRLFD